MSTMNDANVAKPQRCFHNSDMPLAIKDATESSDNARLKNRKSIVIAPYYPCNDPISSCPKFDENFTFYEIFGVKEEIKL